MSKVKWKVYAVWVAVCELVGILSGLLSAEGMARYNVTAAKPDFTPPGWIFIVVWTILFALMGIGAARVSLSETSKARTVGLNTFVVQLVVNFFWPLFFFNLQVFGFAFIWLILLWILVAFTIIQFWQADRTAAWLLVPYLAWLTFAVVLNGAVWLMNG